MNKLVSASALVLILAPTFVLRADDGLVQAYLELSQELNAMVSSAIDAETRVEPDVVASRLDDFLFRSIPPEGVKALKDEDVAVLFRASIAVGGLAPDHVPAVMIELADRLEESSGVGGADGSNSPMSAPSVRAYQRLLGARKFKEARELARRFGIRVEPWVENLEHGQGGQSSHAAYLRFGKTNGVSSAEIVALDVTDGNWLIVEAHPDCAFSRRAQEWFSGHSALLENLTQDRVLWVVTQGRTGAVDSIIEWNDSNPDTQIVLAYRDRNWPNSISFLETPVFNFFKDGELVDKVSGWPGDAQIDALRASARKLGDPAQSSIN